MRHTCATHSTRAQDTQQRITRMAQQQQTCARATLAAGACGMRARTCCGTAEALVSEASSARMSSRPLMLTGAWQAAAGQHTWDADVSTSRALIASQPASAHMHGARTRVRLVRARTLCAAASSVWSRSEGGHAQHTTTSARHASLRRPSGLSGGMIRRPAASCGRYLRHSQWWRRASSMSCVAVAAPGTAPRPCTHTHLDSLCSISSSATPMLAGHMRHASCASSSRQRIQRSCPTSSLAAITLCACVVSTTHIHVWHTGTRT
jgi:hypothetical protein